MSDKDSAPSPLGMASCQIRAEDPYLSSAGLVGVGHPPVPLATRRVTPATHTMGSNRCWKERGGKMNVSHPCVPGQMVKGDFHSGVSVSDVRDGMTDPTCSLPSGMQKTDLQGDC